MRVLLFASAILFAVALGTQPAEAGRIKYNLGDFAITQVAELPQEEPFKINGAFVNLGWLHKEYSIFGAAFWVFDEQSYVLYTKSAGKVSYYPLTEGMLAVVSQATGKRYPAAYDMSVWQRWAGLIVFSSLMTLGLFRRRRKR